MPIRTIIPALWVLIIVLAGGVDAEARERRTLMHGGIERSYLIQAAPQSASKPAPIIILLHGGTQSARQVWRQTTLPAIAEREGAILVAPDAVGDNWNDYRTIYFGGDGGGTLNVDDVGFVDRLIDVVIAEHNGDPQRVFVTGASNGGYMSYRIGCELSHRVAAIAPVIATMLVQPERVCQPTQPIAVQIVAGTADPFVPYYGGTVTVRGVTAEPRMSAPETAAFWARHNGCAATPGVEQMPDLTTDDASTVRRDVFQGCAPRAPVVFYTMDGGGHVWPQIRPVRAGLRWLERILGPVNQDIDAGEVIWGFFAGLE